MTSSEDIEQILTAKGVKPTANRLLVLRCLLRASAPMSLADVERDNDFTLDKSTIFRTLTTFADADIVHTIDDGSGAAKYEICRGRHSHSIDDQHIHFFCTRCQRTFCIDETKLPHVDLPAGFEIHSANYVLRGLCPSCSSH